MIVLTPPACLSMKPPGLMSVEKMNPGLQTICTSVNWCLSLAVCFWGLRRVKYAWLQHGWLQVFPKQQTNDMKSLFGGDKQNSEWIFLGERAPRELQQLNGSYSDTYWEHTYMPNRCVTSRTNIRTRTHICYHLQLVEEETNLKIATETHLSNLFIKLPNAPLNECN